MKHKVQEEYRPAAFWSFNDILDEKELTIQLEKQCEAGLSGGFMHSRVGLVTEYLSEEWMRAVRHCCEEARQHRTSVWLYDEDKFPSGYAGGKVLEEDPSLGSKMLCLMPAEQSQTAEVLKVYKKVIRNGKEYALALVGVKFGDPWFGGKTYVDLLNPKTIGVFLNSTHERYRAYLGEYFENTIRGVFSDEFCYTRKGSVAWPSVPFSEGLEQVFSDQMNYDLVSCMEKLFFDEGDYRVVRRDFYEFVTKRFRDCFVKPYHEWCRKHGLIFTGHLMGEDSLTSQTEWIGAAMPHYLDMDMPGIDKLGLDLGNHMLVRQLTSVAEQTGKRSLCEAFGCIGQQYGPKKLKQIADWLCAQGISFINPHLALYSMRGERKRDCPPNISWLQPWFANSKNLFEHMARVCGFVHGSKEKVDLLVLHPIQSVWAEFSPLHKTNPTYSIWAEKNPYAGMNYITETESYEKPFLDLSEQLIKAGLGYHYGDELVMEEIGWFEAGLKIGNCCYQTVIVPPVSVLKRGTLQLLKLLADTNGRTSVIFIGSQPTCVPAAWQGSFTIAKNIAEAVSVAMSRTTCKVRITNAISRKVADKVLHRYGVTEHGTEVVFAANSADKRSFDTLIDVPFLPMALDTMTGEYVKVPCKKTDTGYCCRVRFEVGGSILLVSEGPKDAEYTSYLESGVWLEKRDKLLNTILPTVTLPEDNLLPLDIVDLVSAGQRLEQRPIESLWHTVFYKLPEGAQFSASYHFYVASVPKKAPTAWIEMARNLSGVKVNGVSAEVMKGPGNVPCFDQNYDRIILEHLHTGENVITLEGQKINNIIGVGNHCTVRSGREHKPTELETVYIGGDFGVWERASGGYEIGERPHRLTGSVIRSAHPFYAGRIIAGISLPASREARLLCVRADAQSASLTIDGTHVADACIAPFIFKIPPTTKEQKVEIVLYNSLANVFGPLHLAEREQLDMTGPALMVDMNRYTTDCSLFEYGLWNIAVIEDSEEVNEVVEESIGR